MRKIVDSTGIDKKAVPEKLHIVLVISSLSSGGAERIMSMMANYWAQQGRRVTLVTIDSCDTDFYELDAGVNRIGLSLLGQSENLLDALASNFTRLKALRCTIKSLMPDVIISFMDRTNILCLVSCYDCQIPIIVSERIDPRKHKTGRLWSFLRKRFYPRAASVVVQTSDVSKWMSEHFSCLRTDVIPNPVTPGQPQGQAHEDLHAKVVVAVGRLHQQKGFDLLIEAFSKCHRVFPDWSLVIFGEGPEREILESLVRRFGLEGKVTLLGRIKNPERVIGTAGIFVMPSRYEGFPNALLEAMTCGLPIVATDCQSGPREIISDGIDGMIVPVGDTGALSEALARLMGDPEEQCRLGENARASVKRFSLPTIMGQWEDLLEQVALN